MNWRKYTWISRIPPRLTKIAVEFPYLESLISRVVLTFEVFPFDSNIDDTEISSKRRVIQPYEWLNYEAEAIWLAVIDYLLNLIFYKFKVQS